MSDYKRNPRGARRARKSLSRKALVVLSLMMVLAVAAVGGTIAWLTVETDSVVNTFTVGNIDITLTETWNADSDSDEDTDNDHWEAKMIPGNQYSKDPKVTVVKGSEPCWLFVKFTESDKADTYLNYSFRADGWTQGDGTTIPANVWYRLVDASAEEKSFYLLTGNTTYPNGYVEIDADEVTKDTMTEAAAVTLTFQAYAVQKDNVADAATAWAKLPTP